MVFLAEGHLALGRFEAHAFHGLDQGVGRSVTLAVGQRRHNRHGSREAAGREEVRRCLELAVMTRHHRFIDRVLRNAEVVIRRPFHARQILVRGHRRQDVAAGRDLDAVALQVEIDDLERVAGTGPDDPDDLAPGLVLELVDQALRAGREVGGGGRQVFLVHQLGFLDRILERLDAVAAEGVVLRQGGQRHAGFVHRHRVRDRILRTVASGAEDVLVPLLAGDRIGHRRLDQQDLLVLFGHRQHGQRHAGGGRADSQIGLVVGVGGCQQGLAQIGLALVVLLDHHEFLAGHHHGAAGRVVETHHEAGRGLLAVGFERPGLAVDMGDPDFLGLRQCQRRSQGASQRGGGQCGARDPSTTIHVCLQMG